MFILSSKNRNPKFGQIETRINGGFLEFRTIVPFDNYFFTIGTGLDISVINNNVSASLGFTNQTEWTQLTDNASLLEGIVCLLIALN